MPHVPTVDIRRLGDIRFDTQLEKALAPSPDYDVQQWLFVPNEYTEYRYILGTRGKKPLICIGINPSGRWCGPPGGPSSKSAPTSGPVWRI